MKIGTYYRLPDGRKGLYVGEDENGYNFAVRGGGDVLDLATEDRDNLEEYREPRTWEVEVRIFEDANGNHIVDADFAWFTISQRMKLVGREKVVVQEGEGL